MMGYCRFEPEYISFYVGTCRSVFKPKSSSRLNVMHKKLNDILNNSWLWLCLSFLNNIHERRHGTKIKIKIACSNIKNYKRNAYIHGNV